MVALLVSLSPRLCRARAAERSAPISLADGSLQAKRRRRDAGRGKTGTNRPVLESHARRKRMAGDRSSSVAGVVAWVGYDTTAATEIVSHSASRRIHGGSPPPLARLRFNTVTTARHLRSAHSTVAASNVSLMDSWNGSCTDDNRLSTIRHM